MRSLFLASDGRINLFWRVLLAFLGTFIIYLIFDLAAGLFLYLGLHIRFSFLTNVYTLAYNTDLRVVISYSIAYVLIAAGTVWWLRWFRRKVDRRSPVGLAWTGLSGHWRGILVGALLGLSLPLLALGAGIALGLFTLHIARLSWWGLVIAIIFNVVQYTATGVREETTHRGYVFQNLGERLPLWLSMAGAGLFFVFAHLLNGLSYITLSFIIVNLLLSTIWIYGRLLTRSLWFSISMHAALDVCSFLIGILLFSGQGNLNAIAAQLLWLELPCVVIIFLALTGWMLWRKRRIDWNARLMENGELAGSMPSFSEERVMADVAK